MSLLQCWRWYGDNDVVTINDIRQGGAEGIVHALHEIPVGEVWEYSAIMKRKLSISKSKLIDERQLDWRVVESLNVHENIKQARPDRDVFIQKYIQSLKNIGKSGIDIVCYNFMPLLDWTRTNLSYKTNNGSLALKFDKLAYVAFDLFILERTNSENEYSEDQKILAEEYFKKLTPIEIEKLTTNILQGVPGSLEVLSLKDFKELLLRYSDINQDQLRQNLQYFLQAVVPEAENAGVKLCCHPDDPPFSLFGIPRVVSTESDIEFLLNAIDNPSNGITFCTGSLGVRVENDLPAMVKRFANKIHFAHLRNVSVANDGSFVEDNHLEGNVDMYNVMRQLILESNRRKEKGLSDYRIPFRPDHGHQMLDDLNKEIPFHGYSAIGRLKGLAELRGLELGITESLI